MAMLAEPRKKKKYVVIPKGKPLYEDENRFGSKILKQMGWKKGQGLGPKGEGDPEFIRLRYKDSPQGLGYQNRDDQWTKHDEDFNALLQNLSKNCNDVTEEKPTGVGFLFHPSKNDETSFKTKLSGVSLEARSKQSKARVHYKKFTKSKDVTQYSEKDLSNIFGKKDTSNANDIYKAFSAITVPQKGEVAANDKTPNCSGVQMISTGVSVSDYFKQKMEQLKLKKLNSSPIIIESVDKAVSATESCKRKVDRADIEYKHEKKKRVESKIYENVIECSKVLEAADNKKLPNILCGEVSEQKPKQMEFVNESPLVTDGLNEHVESKLRDKKKKRNKDKADRSQVSNFGENFEEQLKIVKRVDDTNSSTIGIKELVEYETNECMEDSLIKNVSECKKKKRKKLETEVYRINDIDFLKSITPIDVVKETNFKDTESTKDDSLEDLEEIQNKRRVKSKSDYHTISEGKISVEIIDPVIENLANEPASANKKERKKSKNKISNVSNEKNDYNFGAKDENDKTLQESFTIVAGGCNKTENRKKYKSKINETTASNSLEDFTGKPKISKAANHEILQYQCSPWFESQTNESMKENSLDSVSETQNKKNNNKTEYHKNNQIEILSSEESKLEQSNKKTCGATEDLLIKLTQDVFSEDVSEIKNKKNKKEISTISSKTFEKVDGANLADNLCSDALNDKCYEKQTNKVDDSNSLEDKTVCEQKNTENDAEDHHLKTISKLPICDEVITENSYIISGFSAEKFRNVVFDQYNGSNLSEIIGYGLNDDIDLKVVTNKTDEGRITQFWNCTVTKYIKPAPRTVYAKHIKKMFQLKKQNGKCPKFAAKKWKRKNAFQCL